MRANDFFKILNCEIYKVDTKIQKDLILFDIDSSIYYSETTLGKCYDILIEKNPYVFYYVLNEIWYNKNEANVDFAICYNKGIFDLEILKKIPVDYIKENLNKFSKTVFEIFRANVFSQKINVYNLSFVPIEERVVTLNNLKFFNIYKNNCFFTNLKPKPNNDFEHIEFLLKNILQVGYDYFIKFLSWKIKNPLEPIDCHFVIQDDGGTGKTKILSNILCKLINSVTISQNDLDSNFNSYMVNSLIVICEEIEAYENERKLKYLTGVGGTIRINEKGKGEYDIVNYSNWFLLSNDKKSIKISDKDRRFIIIGGGKRLSPLSDGDWSKTIFKNMEDNHNFFDGAKGYHKNFDKELKNFYQNLISLDVQKKELLINLPTLKKEELIKLNYTSEQEFINEIIEIGLDNMFKEYSNHKDISKCLIFIDKENSVNYGYWIRTSLFYQLYNDYCRVSNMKPLQKFNFFRRIYDFDEFNKYFDGNVFISHNGTKFRAIKISDDKYQDENVTIKKEVDIEIDKTKNSPKKIEEVKK